MDQKAREAWAEKTAKTYREMVPTPYNQPEIAAARMTADLAQAALSEEWRRRNPPR
jgi:hypothetical protein